MSTAHPALGAHRKRKTPALAGVFGLLAGACTATALAQQPSAASEDASTAMTVSRNGTRPSTSGPEANFTGRVRVDPLFQPSAPSRVSASYVTFEPGARSAWHTHPQGQTLVVTAGTGWVQQEGGQKQEIKPGDVILTPPGVKHWHGATATTAMTHIAIQEVMDGKSVQWMEKVDDAVYGR